MIQLTELKIHQRINDGVDAPFYVDFALDLSDNQPILINKSISDVHDLSSRKADITKTITLPGTDNNNKIFSHIFKIARSLARDDSNPAKKLQNFNPDFDPTLKALATIYKNGVVLMSGYLQLTSIRIIDDKKIEYDVIIIGLVGNIFLDMAEAKLDELDFHEYNHTWNLTNIGNSWTGTLGAGYLYGMIDYDLQENQTNFLIEQWYPQVYLKTIIDKIFSKWGYRYSSAFFNSERFKRLVVPFSGNTFTKTATAVDNNTCSAIQYSDSGWVTIGVGGSSQNFQLGTVVKQTIPPPPFGGWDGTANTFTVPESGNYTFNLNLNFSIRNSVSTGAIPFGLFQIESYRNLVQFDIRSVSGIIPATQGSLNFSFAFQTGKQYFVAGDVITFKIKNNTTYTSIDAKFLANSTLQVINDPINCEGSMINLSSCLPSNVNQSDLLKSIIKMFNLYIVGDVDDPNQLIIEPYEDFFSGPVVDLTNFVDYGNEVKILPMGALQSKTYTYSYKSDKDELNSIHENQFTDTYGIRRFNIINDFVKAEYQTEIIFAPTPLKDYPGQNNRIQSRICFLDTNNQRQVNSAVIRLLYYGGKIGCSWYTINSRITGNNVIGYVSYAYVGHLDSWSNPTFDLSFGVPVQLQYAALKYTTANLFNIYHRKSILEIIDPDSKIIEYKFHLNEVQQNALNFQNSYLINKQYYQLYDVEFDANSLGLTTIKFLKLKNQPKYINTSSLVNGGSGNFGNDGIEIAKLPIYSMNINGVYSNGQGTLIQGSSVLQNSPKNTILADGISVVGGGGNILNQSGITLLNCSGFSSTIKNEVVANNIQLPFLITLNYGLVDISGIGESAKLVLPKVDGYYTEITDVYANISFNGVGFPMAFGNSTMNLIYTSSTEIAAQFTSDVLNATAPIRQRAFIPDNVNQQCDSLSINCSPSIAASRGNGRLILEIYYRIHLIV